MLFKTFITFFSFIVVNEVCLSRGEKIQEIGYALGDEYNNWGDQPPRNFTMIFHSKKLPKGILFGFSGYVVRSADVVFQVWREENNLFKLVQEYKHSVEVSTVGERQTFRVKDISSSACEVMSPGNYFGIHVPGDLSPFPIIFTTEKLSIIDVHPERKLDIPQNISKFYFPLGMSASAYVDTDLSNYNIKEESAIACPDIKIPPFSLLNNTTPPSPTTQPTKVTVSPGAAKGGNSSDDSGLATEYLILIIVLSILLFICILLAIFCFVKHRTEKEVAEYRSYRNYPEDFSRSKTTSTSKINFVTQDDIHNKTMSSTKSFA